jgi:hypothetical protein
MDLANSEKSFPRTPTRFGQKTLSSQNRRMRVKEQVQKVRGSGGVHRLEYIIK